MHSIESLPVLLKYCRESGIGMLCPPHPTTHIPSTELTHHDILSPSGNKFNAKRS